MIFTNDNGGERLSSFDLARDPRERHELGYQHQTRVKEMQRLLNEWEAQFPK